MTFLFRPLKQIKLSWFNPSHSGALAANDYITLTAGNTNNLSITGTGTNTLTFPPGRYHLRATLGGYKTNLTDTIEYRWEVGGTLKGNTGSWDTSTNKKMTCEYAEVVFEATGNTNVKLKCLATSGSNSLTSDVSGVFIRGSQ